MTPTQEDREAALAATGWQRWEDACIALSDMEMAELAVAFMRHRLAAEERGARMALEAAAKVVEDGAEALSWSEQQSDAKVGFELKKRATAIRQIDPASLGAE